MLFANGYRCLGRHQGSHPWDPCVVPRSHVCCSSSFNHSRRHSSFSTFRPPRDSLRDCSTRASISRSRNASSPGVRVGQPSAVCGGKNNRFLLYTLLALFLLLGMGFASSVVGGVYLGRTWSFFRHSSSGVTAASDGNTATSGSTNQMLSVIAVVCGSVMLLSSAVLLRVVLCQTSWKPVSRNCLGTRSISDCPESNRLPEEHTFNCELSTVPLTPTLDGGACSIDSPVFVRYSSPTPSVLSEWNQFHGTTSQMPHLPNYSQISLYATVDPRCHPPLVHSSLEKTSLITSSPPPPPLLPLLPLSPLAIVDETSPHVSIPQSISQVQNEDDPPPYYTPAMNEQENIPIHPQSNRYFTVNLMKDL